MSMEGIRAQIDPFGAAERWAKEQKFELMQWPIKLRKVPVNAPFFHKAHLLVASDCAALCHTQMHRYMTPGRIPVICCPEADYGTVEQLAKIIALNDIRSVTVLCMKTACCEELADQVQTAIRLSRKRVPIQIIGVFMEAEECDL